MFSDMESAISRKFNLLRTALNERQCRLWAAAETLALGHGGSAIVSRATGISQPTLRNGIKELNAPPLCLPKVWQIFTASIDKNRQNV